MQQVEVNANAAKPGKKRPQSRVTSLARQGVTTFLDGRDKRGPVARRFRDLVGQVTADLGGPELLSENQRQIIRRIASLSVWCEGQEGKMADGDEIDIDEFQRTSNSLRRLCETIGLERRSREVTPMLEHYLGHRAAERAADERSNVAAVSDTKAARNGPQESNTGPSRDADDAEVEP